MPIRFSLNHTDKGYLIILPSYVKALLTLPAPRVLPSSMFVGFGKDQAQVGDAKRPFFSDLNEALVYQLLNDKNTALKDGVFLMGVKIAPGETANRFVRQHYQFTVSHEELERTKSILKPTGHWGNAPIAEEIANRIHKTCTLAIEPVVPSNFVPDSKNPVQHWTLNKGLTEVILPERPKETDTSFYRNQTKI